MDARNPAAGNARTPHLPAEAQEAAMERVGKALADTSRRRILLALLDAPHYPADLADELGLTRANVSNHLACLRDCGLVRTVPEGRRTRYHLADDRLAHALRDLLAAVLPLGDPPPDVRPADVRP